MPDRVIIPETITVHLGAPDSPAPNVTLPFTDYIKNVASSEIYPTWPESALRANIYAQISLALNRIYTEFYRSRGYDFDITSSTSFDQAFQNGRDYFSNISKIVDEIFDNYVVEQGFVQPLFTSYCDGVRVNCNGLSQWGTVSLANSGYTPYEILQYYYGDNIDIRTAQLSDAQPSYPGSPIRRGQAGENVRTIQRELNRISRNYPAIPEIPSTNGIFDAETENAVREFQRIFNLTPDGVVGFSTWYAIKRIFGAVKRLSELYSEGITITEAQRQYPRVLQKGDTGVNVSTLQYYLGFAGEFLDTVPTVAVDGIFGEDTENAVRAFQASQNLTPDGVVGSSTWNSLISFYSNTLNALPYEYSSYSSLLYPGYFITPGAQGKVVEQLQTFLRVIGENSGIIPVVSVTGEYDAQTENAVRRIQSQQGLPVNGSVGPATWNVIVNLYNQYRNIG